jgi:hypothetical protein
VTAEFLVALAVRGEQRRDRRRDVIFGGCQELRRAAGRGEIGLRQARPENHQAFGG